MTDSLDAARIAGLSRAARQGLAIEVVATTASTNADLRRRAASLPGPLLLAAERQTAGRGRAGRSWLSAPGDSLCFSMAWPFAGALQRLAGLSLAVGVALAEDLRDRGTPVMLKWPNDLLVGEAKLGGILIESLSQPGRDSSWAVIGVGLNVRANPVRDAALGHPVAALAGAGIELNPLLAQLADALVMSLQVFERDGLAPFIARWDALHAHAGQPVSIIEQGRLLHQGVALGIDTDGCLQLDTAAGIVKVAAGDVSLRVIPQDSRLGSEASHAAD